MRSALIKRARKRPRLLLGVLSMLAMKRACPSRRLRTRLANEVDERLARLFDTVSLADVYWLMKSLGDAGTTRSRYGLSLDHEDREDAVRGMIISTLLHRWGMTAARANAQLLSKATI